MSDLNNAAKLNNKKDLYTLVRFLGFGDGGRGAGDGMRIIIQNLPFKAACQFFRPIYRPQFTQH